MTDQGDVRVGMVGYSFMGYTHSHGWRNARSFFAAPVKMQAIAGRNAEAVQETADRFGWHGIETDWRTLINRSDIDLIDICTPGDTHAEIAIAALQAGKHVLCEKPLANSVEEAEAMTAAAESARAKGVRSMVGFTYRQVPAIGLARQLVAEGKIGAIRHVRAQYLQDFLTDPEMPLMWRLQKERAGSGALGDIGAHIIDLTQYITGENITGVTAMMETFIKQRPVPTEASGLSGVGGEERGPVTVDDATTFLARLDGGALGTFEATRFASGRKNAIHLEINGEYGSLLFDFEDMNVLHVHDHTEDPRTHGFKRVLVTEASHPHMEAWWPPGHVLGYEHGFTHQAVDLITALREDRDPAPSFADGLGIQRVLDAVERSAESGSTWTAVSTSEGANS